VVALADRIAYCAHDLEDAIHARIVSNEELPRVVAERCGTSRGRQLNAFVTDAVATTLSSGMVAISEPVGEALEVLRRFNYERIYLRQASIEQSAAVVELLRALVEHYVSDPTALPGAAGLVPDDPDTVRAAVGYVSGMTDRFACSKAVDIFGDRAVVLVSAMKPL
jgi:dGTPase